MTIRQGRIMAGPDFSFPFLFQNSTMVMSQFRNPSKVMYFCLPIYIYIYIYIYISLPIYCVLFIFLRRRGWEVQ